MTLRRYILTVDDHDPEQFTVWRGMSAMPFRDGSLRWLCEDLEQIHFQESIPLPVVDGPVETGSMGDLGPASPFGVEGSEGIAVPGQACPVGCPNATAKE